MQPRIIKSYQGVIGYDEQTTLALVVDGPDIASSDYDSVTIEYIIEPTSPHGDDYGFQPMSQTIEDLPGTVVFDGLIPNTIYIFTAITNSGDRQSIQNLTRAELSRFWGIKTIGISICVMFEKTGINQASNLMKNVGKELDVNIELCQCVTLCFKYLL